MPLSYRYSRFQRKPIQITNTHFFIKSGGASDASAVLDRQQPNCHSGQSGPIFFPRFAPAKRRPAQSRNLSKLLLDSVTVRAAIVTNFPLYGRSTAAPHLGKLPGVDQTSLPPQELFLPQTGNPCKVSNTKESNDRHALDPSQIHPQHRNNRSGTTSRRRRWPSPRSLTANLHAQSGTRRRPLLP